MIILIPLGGTGERFKNNNYKLPKALIKIFGKPIIYYLLDCLDTTNVKFVYIPYNQEYAKYRFEDKLINDYPNISFKFLQLKKNTDGAAHTINIALNELKIDLEDCPILCLDCDNFYTYNEPIYSYVKIDTNNNIIDIIEKVKISDNACSGAYGFDSYKKLQKYTKFIIENNVKQKNEFYISGV